MKKYLILGMMSGTSADGIDTTICETNGLVLKRKNIEKSFPYPKILQKKIISARNNPTKLLNDTSALKSLDLEITNFHIFAVKNICKKFSITPDFLGFHGQTVFHDPKNKISNQLGNGIKLAKETGIPTVYDFRRNDLMNGGEGAPLAPIYHQMLINNSQLQYPSVFLNIGGVANITICNDEKLIGYDIGPGNCLIDDLCMKKFGKRFDKDGKIASNGVINKKFIDIALCNSFFKKSGPKSIDRSAFNYLLNESIINKISSKDAIATITAFTGKYICNILDSLKPYPQNVIISGGGVKNKTLIREIRKNLNSYIKLIFSEQIGGNAQMIEAELISFLTARKINNLPSTFPHTTGVKSPQICGVLAKPL